MKKQPQVTEQTRANLTSAFWELYLTKPIEKITIREITDRAGYNRATFYLYYRDVYDLLEQLEAGILAEIGTLVGERLLAGDTLDFTEHMGLIVNLAHRFDGYMPRLLACDPTFGERLKALIAPLLDRFIIPDCGLSASEQEILREYYLSGLLSAISTWVAQTERIPIDRLIGLVIAAVKPGVDAPALNAGLSASASRP